VGTASVLAAGILDLEVELVREVPSPAVIPATLRINCNLPGIPTGLAEGYWLSIPGTPFVEGGAGGVFEPLEPNVGITIFSSGVEFGAWDQAWRQEFERVHRRLPALEDRADRIWSLEFQARTGRAPGDAGWVPRWRTVAS